MRLSARGLHLLHATGQDNLHLELVCKSNELEKEESPFYSLTLSQIVHKAEKKDNKISNSFIPFSAFRGTSAHVRVQGGYLKGLVSVIRSVLVIFIRTVKVEPPYLSGYRSLTYKWTRVFRQSETNWMNEMKYEIHLG